MPYILLFLISPILALFEVTRGKKANKVVFSIVFTLFGVFFGYHFNSTALKSSDSYQHMLAFKYLDLSQNLSTYLVSQFQYHGDVIIPLLRYVTRTFTNNVSIYFAIIGGIYMLIMSKLLWELILRQRLQRTPQKYWNLTILIILAFASTYSLVTINAVRFPLAVLVFVYGNIAKSYYQSNWGYLFILLSPFIHLGFWLVVPLFFLSRIVPLKIMQGLTLFFLIFSLLPVQKKINTFEIQNTLVNSEYAALQKRTNYVNEEYISISEQGKSSKNWYVSLRYEYLRFIFRIIMILVLLRFWVDRQQVDNWRFLLFGLLLMGASITFNESMHSIGRFASVGMMLAFFWMVANGGLKYIRSKLLKYNLTASIILYLVVEIRVFFYFTTIDVILSNPIFSIFLKSEITLDNIIK